MRSLLLVAALLLATPAAYAADPADDCLSHAEHLLDALQRGDAAAVTTDFDAAMHQAISGESMLALWRGLPQRWGALQARGQPQARQAGGYTQGVTRLDFAHGSMDALVSCNAQQQIAGFHLRPSEAQPNPAPVSPLPAGVSERAQQVATPLGPLSGTLTLPAGQGPFAAVVLVQGSGPHDRDESSGPNKPFRDLAIGLAQAGIASLRYDKRTLTYGAAMAGSANITVDQEVTDDAVTAIELVRGLPMIDAKRVFLLGHSLGAAMAPRIGQRAPDLAGLILLAAPARPLQQIIVAQRIYLHGLHPAADPHFAAQLAVMRQRAAVIDRLDPAHLPSGPLLMNVPVSYWLSLRGYDPVTAARALHMPLLVLQGLDDYQVTPKDDFARWQQTFAHDAQVRLIGYPNLSHHFTPGGNPPSPADYQQPAQVEPKVIDDIAQWIAHQPDPRR